MRVITKVESVKGLENELGSEGGQSLLKTFLQR
jgi:hypothetical protein